MYAAIRRCIYPAIVAWLCGTSAGTEVREDAARVVKAAGGSLVLGASQGDTSDAVVGVDLGCLGVDERPLQALERLPALKTLDLTGARISGDALRHVAHLKDLESLTLIGTRVGDDGLRHLAGLTRLRHLDLTGTDVGDAGLAHLVALQDLETLRLAGTLVTDAGLARIRAFRNLRTLDLFGTRITERGVLHLDTLTQLRELDIRGPPVTIDVEPPETGLCKLARRGSLSGIKRVSVEPFNLVDPASVAGLAGLQALYLPRLNLWDESQLQALGRLKELRLLDLSDAYFQINDTVRMGDEAWAHLAGLEKLESLSLSFIGVTEGGLAHIARLKRLRHLLLGRTGITGRCLKHLAPLTDLRSLHLWSNDLDADDLANLPELEHLKALYLCQNNLGADGLKTLPRLDSLALLDLSGCELPPSELRRLRRFPKLRDLYLRSTEFDDKALEHLRGMKSLGYLDLSYTHVTEEGIQILRRALPELETVRHQTAQPYQPEAVLSRADVFDQILVQALVRTSTNAPNTTETRGTVIQVYLGPQSLHGEPFLAYYGDGYARGAYTSLGSGRLASDALVITYLKRRPDGTLEMVREQLRWPAWLGPSPLPIPWLGSENPNYRRRREEAEFLRTASDQPESERIAFLERAAVRGSKVESTWAFRLLLMDPIDNHAEALLLRSLKDETVPLLRRIRIDHNFWYRPERPWVHSPDRLALLRQWADRVQTQEGAELLAADLKRFADVRRSWMSLPAPKDRAAGLLATVQAIQDNSEASAAAKAHAVQALRALPQGVGRDAGLDLLVRLAKDPSDDYLQGSVVGVLAEYAPFSGEERKRVRGLLDDLPDEALRKTLEEALARPMNP